METRATSKLTEKTPLWGKQTMKLPTINGAYHSGARRTLARTGFAITLILALASVTAVCAELNREDRTKDRANIVMTNTGAVRGSVTDGMRMFLGIPYAARPVGSLRWRPSPTACKLGWSA